MQIIEFGRLRHEGQSRVLYRHICLLRFAGCDRHCFARTKIVRSFVLIQRPSLPSHRPELPFPDDEMRSDSVAYSILDYLPSDDRCRSSVEGIM